MKPEVQLRGEAMISVSKLICNILTVVTTSVISALMLTTTAQANDFVICESDNDRYRRCPVARARDLGSANIRVVAKFSKSACNEGRSWGVERGAIWVDRGCRARFEIDYDNRHSNPSWNHSYDWDPYGRYNSHDSYDRYDRNSPYNDYRPGPAQRELEYERERLERERRRLEQERLAHERERLAQEQARARSCPPGSRPGRCSDNDRRYGCRDWRTNSGLGCRSN